MGKILVTGGAGYIGSQICKLLRKDKNEIIFLIIFQQEKKIYKVWKFIYGDLRKKRTSIKLLKIKKSSVIHLQVV